VTSVLEINFKVMRYTNSRLTYLLIGLLTILYDKKRTPCRKARARIYRAA